MLREGINRKHAPQHSYRVARIYAALRERDAAFTWLREAFTERAENLVWMKVDPHLDNLRSDERFAELLRRVGRLHAVIYRSGDFNSVQMRRRITTLFLCTLFAGPPLVIVPIRYGQSVAAPERLSSQINLKWVRPPPLYCETSTTLSSRLRTLHLFVRSNITASKPT